MDHAAWAQRGGQGASRARGEKCFEPPRLSRVTRDEQSESVTRDDSRDRCDALSWGVQNTFLRARGRALHVHERAKGVRGISVA